MPLTFDEPASTANAVDAMSPQPYRVAAMGRETHDTFTLALEPANGADGARFAAGQFSMLYVFGVGELPISISGDPDQAGRLVYTVRSVGPATQALVSRQPGDWLGVRGPFGAAWPLDAVRGKDVLIIAGGIGLAPLRPAIYHIMHHRDDYVRLIVLYGARSPGDLLYKKELAVWARSPDTQVLTTVDYGGVNWRGRVGVVTTLFRHLRMHPDKTVAFVCGSRSTKRTRLRCSWANSSVRWTPFFRPRSAENKMAFRGLLSFLFLFVCRSFRASKPFGKERTSHAWHRPSSLSLFLGFSTLPPQAV